MSTYVVMDNQIYGLTTGQASPTTTKGHKTKSTPAGNFESPTQSNGLSHHRWCNFLSLVDFQAEAKQLSDLIQAGIDHRGFALIDVFSPCVTYNK